ncbi:LysR family transcriptional regulator [Celeribacter indicus]|uniref:HTH lysR-type domain-containing protein n=1 Tax=Celeribacter indicus TaxID=1208324 RepID=A0A0B5E388_9RHOB|nr:LysR family transcriptional regulator [Celeribacter indicus]AJE47860.1 hypothetical protein P73_3145 [Celeribacter indicus]SDW25186.1 transcriptional regulator, LysR family [Celeribacter indicus]
MHATLRQLETLKTFTLTRSVTETARLMHVTQPAVSQALRELEAQLGFAIYTRIGNRTLLTAETQAVIPEIERVLAAFSTLQSRVSEMKDSRAGTVSIISPPTACVDLIPRAIKQFKAQRPNLRIHLEVSTEALTERKVRDELFDLGMGFYPQQEINIAAQPILETEMICVVHKDHPLAGRAVLDPRQIAGHSVVVVHHEGNVVSRMYQLLTNKIDPNSLISTNQSIGAFNLVRQGGMVAVLHPMSVPEFALSQMSLARFEPQMPVTMALYYSRRRPLSRISGKFMLALRESAAIKAELLNARGIPFKVTM